MKSYIFLLAAAATMALGACQENKAGKPTAAAIAIPRPGTLITAAEQPVSDELNKFAFSVKVIADSNVAEGVYDVDVDFGPNFAESKLSMPKGGERFVPAIRKGSAPYTYIIGFHIPDDTAFYDYMEVSSNKGATKMQYIKAYSF